MLNSARYAIGQAARPHGPTQHPPDSELRNTRPVQHPPCAAPALCRTHPPQHPPDSVLRGSAAPGRLACTAFITTEHSFTSAWTAEPQPAVLPPAALPLPGGAPPLAASLPPSPHAAPPFVAWASPSMPPLPLRPSAAAASQSNETNPSARVPKANAGGRMRAGRRHICRISTLSGVRTGREASVHKMF